jgi:hypothetical protein
MSNYKFLFIFLVIAFSFEPAFGVSSFSADEKENNPDLRKKTAEQW